MTSAVGLSVLVLLLLLFLKTPVFAAILSAPVVYFLMTPSFPTRLIAQRFVSGMESIPLLAVPFFVCAGVFMNHTGVTMRIMNFCEVVTGRMWGGLAQVNILLSTLMGGLSGSSLADAAMQSKMLVPEMEKRGFSKPFSTVVTAVSSMITPLIPPGIGMILYGSIANISIGKLFVSGVGIGGMLCVLLMVLAAVMSKMRGYQQLRTTGTTRREFWLAAKRVILPLCLPVVIIGGIRIGAFTPTEAGAVAIVYTFILGLVYRELRMKDIWEGLRDTVITTASIMLIVGASSALAWVLTKEQIPQKLTSLILGMVDNKIHFLLIINLFLLIVGMFIEGNAATIVLVPLLVPMARAFNIDDSQFAMIFIFNMAIGAITPPMGTLMFVACGITKCKIKDFLIEAIPFFCVLLTCLFLISFVPFVSLALIELFW